MIKPIKTLKPLNIRIPDSLRKQLEVISKREKMPISNLVRQSLEHFVAVRRFRKLRRQIIPFAEAQGFFSDEDFFKEIS